MVNNTLMKICEASKITQLYQDMVKRKGKFIIYKGNINTPDYLFIGEAGGKEEDKCGTPFVGRSGKLLDKWIKELKTTRICVINAVPIMPENEEGRIRKPTKQEIEYFRPYTMMLIQKMNPLKIILLGRSAEEAIHGKRRREGLMKESTWNDQKIGYIHHPSYYLRRGQNGLKEFKKLLEEERK